MHNGMFSAAADWENFARAFPEKDSDQETAQSKLEEEGMKWFGVITP